MPDQQSQIPELKYVVIENWTASYLDPIVVTAGDKLELSGQTDIWDGHTWLWAKSRDGKKGWIPDTLVPKTSTSVAQTDYTAAELTCQLGQILVAEKRTHGWVYCRSDDGQHGWVPEKNLSRAT
ncbi:MAG: hypothetical protein ACI861_000728, partial [Paracoccaceae bacterium]|jgi:hypothetical protein